MAENTPLKNPWPARLAIPVVAAALLAGACSKSENTTTAANGSTTTAGGGKTTQATSGTGSSGTTKGTNKSTNSLNGQKVWFQGFRYELGDISYDSSSYVVTIRAKVTNLGNETASPAPPVALVKGGEQIATGNLPEHPDITGGKTVDAKIELNMTSSSIGSFTTDGVSLVFTMGSAYQEATVPLDGKGSAVTLEPVDQKEAVKPITIGNVTITPKSVEVRYDLPDDHTIEADAGYAFLLIRASTKNTGSGIVGYLTQGVKLTTNTGTYTAEFIGDTSVEGSQTNEKTSFYFKIKTPTEGEWTLDLTDQPFGPDGETVSASQKITPSSKGTTGTTR